MDRREQSQVIADGIVRGVFKITTILVVALLAVAGIGFVARAVPSIVESASDDAPSERIDMEARAAEFAPLAEKQAREDQAREVAANLIALRESTVCAADKTRDQFQPFEDRRSYHPWRK